MTNENAQVEQVDKDLANSLLAAGRTGLDVVEAAYQDVANFRLAATRELEAEAERLKAAKAHIIKDARCAAEAHQQIRRDLEIDNAALRRELEEARGLTAAWVDWEESFAENHELHPFIGRARAALSDGG